MWKDTDSCGFSIISRLCLFFLLSQDLLCQGTTNLVIGGSFDDIWDHDVIYESLSTGEIYLVYHESFRWIDTCHQFGRGFFRFDTSFQGNAISFGTNLVRKYKGLITGGIATICLRLRDTLRRGRVYRVSFYVKASYSSYYVTKYVGLRFFDTCVPMTAVVYEEFDTSWHLDVGPDTVIGSAEWTKVESEYCARGGERYVVVSIWIPRDKPKVIRLLLSYQKLHGHGVRLGYIKKQFIRRKVLRAITRRNPDYKPLGRGRFLKCMIPSYLLEGRGVKMYWTRKNITYFIDEISIVPIEKSCVR